MVVKKIERLRVTIFLRGSIDADGRDSVVVQEALGAGGGVDLVTVVIEHLG